MEPTHQITPEELLGPLNEVERKHAPERLWLAGDVSFFRRGPRVSVVGSRRASREGLNRARRLARALVERGIVVVSGLAEGVDAAAHEAAIEAGGKTIAVLGTPLDQCFPAANRALQDRIMRDHVAVSQLESGSSFGKASFPARNRTMALLTDATVIVEAGPKSGTQHQGWEALRLGRLLFFLRSVATEKNLQWVQDMVGYGAQVLTDENISQALDHMPERSRGEEIPF